jgi:hypothetical protein
MSVEWLYQPKGNVPWKAVAARFVELGIEAKPNDRGMLAVVWVTPNTSGDAFATMREIEREFATGFLVCEDIGRPGGPVFRDANFGPNRGTK